MAKRKWTRAEKAAFAKRMKRYRKQGGKKKSSEKKSSKKIRKPAKGRKASSRRSGSSHESDPRIAQAVRAAAHELHLIGATLKRGLSGRAGRRMLK